MDVMPAATSDVRIATGGTFVDLDERIPLARPRIGDAGSVLQRIAGALASGSLTDGATVRELEDAAAGYLGVRHCIAVASCTTGLMMVIRAAGVTGTIVMPSFTFVATAHAAAWNGCEPAFADIDAGRLTLDPESVALAIHTRTGAILATHLYGAPADAEALEDLASRHGIRLFFDAAHAFGAERHGRRVGGFGDAEVFSLSPTKPLVAAEGGLIATDDDLLAERCRTARAYGHPGDYDARFVGLNGRMSELHAAVALGSLSDLEARLRSRSRLAEAYRAALDGVDGISFPTIDASDRSTFKDLTILVDAQESGITADQLAAALGASGIETRRYYSPPVHRMAAYRAVARRPVPLPVTERAAREAVSLPLWDSMDDDTLERVTSSIREIVEEHRVARGISTG